MPRWYRIQKKLSRLAVGCGFHMAIALSIAPIYNNASVQSAHPVRLLCTVCLLQGAERPIRVRDHPDAAAFCGPEQNRIFLGRIPSRSAIFGCFENFPGILEELAHEDLSHNLTEIRGFR